jgi:hypothetical protein
MELTPIGIALFFLGALFFVVRPGLLYWCAIFFLPFSATAVLNVGSGDSFSGLQAWMFFGTLWLASDLSAMVRTKGHWYKQKMRASVRRLVVFLLVALISLIMPLWIDGRLWIVSGTLTSSEARPLYFRLQHVTQFLYLAYGVLFAIFVGVKNLNLVQFKKTIRIFLISSAFVCSWGFLEWFCHEVGVSYPAYLLNTNKNEAALGYLAQYTDSNIIRITSVATEPSMLAQYLLIVLVFALFAVLGRQVVITVVWDRIVLLLTLLTLLMTTSSTAYLGLVLLIPIFLGSLWALGRLRRWHLVSATVLLVGCVVVVARSTVAQEIADTAILSKADSYSALERINSVVQAEGYFLRYPVLGVGWGTVTSHDLVFKLLADVGIVGLIAFALFLKSLGSGLWKSVAGLRRRAVIPERSYWAACMLVATLILVLTSAFTEFTYVFGHLWFVFGMGLAIPLAAEDRSAARLPAVRQASA